MRDNNTFKKVMLSGCCAFALFLTSCAEVNVANPRNVDIEKPARASERPKAINEGYEPVVYVPLGKDILVPKPFNGDSLPNVMVGPYELRGESLAGALQLILAEYDISLAFETNEGLTRRITVSNLRGPLDRVVERVCGLADLYCSYEDGILGDTRILMTINTNCVT
mgnify:CR=1 FL=1